MNVACTPIKVWLVAALALAAELVGIVVWSPAAHAVSLNAFVVDSLSDTADGAPGDGVCRARSGRCTLRAAVQEANSRLGPDTIRLPSGRLLLSRPLPQLRLPSTGTFDAEVSSASGDLDVYGDLRIVGSGRAATVVDARGIDRAFSIQPVARLTLTDLTVTGGDATRNNVGRFDIADGGGVLNAGWLTLNRVVISQNRADGGGGVFSLPFTQVTIRDSRISDNRAVEGGGLRLDGAAHIADSVIADNHLFVRPELAIAPDEMVGYGGGIDHRGTGNVLIERSRITGNTATKAGGGYNSGQNYVPITALTELWPFRTRLVDTLVAGNTVAGRPDDCHASAMIIESSRAGGCATRTGGAGEARPDTLPRQVAVVTGSGSGRGHDSA